MANDRPSSNDNFLKQVLGSSVIVALITVFGPFLIQRFGSPTPPAINTLPPQIVTVVVTTTPPVIARAVTPKPEPITGNCPPASSSWYPAYYPGSDNLRGPFADGTYFIYSQRTGFVGVWDSFSSRYISEVSIATLPRDQWFAVPSTRHLVCINSSANTIISSYYSP